MQSTPKNTKAPASKLGHIYRLGLVLAVALVAGTMGAYGCLDRPLCSVKKIDQAGNLEEDCRPRTTNLFVDTITNKSVDKIDILFMIDNSSSMADKQAVLAAAVPDLVNRLVSPNCVDSNGAPAGQTPPNPATACPTPGATREFKPITNIHIGIVTSSLGGHGATTCEDTDPTKPNPSLNDHAQLLGTLPRGQASVYPPGTPGFLDWNPNTHAGEDPNALSTAFQSMVKAAGQTGCGLEAQLESIYRFIADPFPPQSIVLQPCRGNAKCAVPTGVDQAILAQRKAFLRGDSLVAIIMLTDENDCSIRDSDQYYYAASLDVFLPGAAAVCGTNPNDPCCYSCGLAPPQGCAPDPSCGPPTPSLNGTTDSPNLRGFEQKRRFGIDFLYPIKRYLNAFTQTRLCSTSVDLTPDTNCPARPDKSPGLVANPLLQDLTNTQAPPRDPSLVFVAAITGVPWELISDDTRSTATELHYKTSDMMTGDGTWDKIVGTTNPQPAGTPPIIAADPHMQESVDPRGGLPGPNTPANADPINGHDWFIANRDDLQYACIFDKPISQPCTDTTCDCYQRKPGENNPLCADPAGAYQQQQFKAKAYPCVRELELLKDFGKNAIVASLCARNQTDTARQDYGYRPAVDAIVDRLKEALTLKCLPRKLEVAADGSVPCSVLEATTNQAELNCASRPGRKAPDSKLIEPARARLAADKACDSDPNTAAPDCSAFGFCEIVQADPSCLQVTPDAAAVGYCYVEPDHQPNPIGDPSLVAKCPQNQRQIIRFIGDNTPVRDGSVLIACLGAPVGGGSTTAAPTGTTPPPPTGGDASP